MLNAVLGQIKRECAEGAPRYYIGDVTLHVGAYTSGQWAERITELFELLSMKLGPDNMVLNDGTQQVLGLTKDVRDVWGQRGFAATRMAKHQAVAASAVEHRGSNQVRCSVVASVLFARCLYRPECQCITEEQLAQMRRAMRVAMGDRGGRRTD